MGKSDAEVIALFNEQVNMTAHELEKWLQDPQSRDAGTGVGIESGRRIVEILRKNPTKNPDAYDEVRAPANNNNNSPCSFSFSLFSPGRDGLASKYCTEFLFLDRKTLRIYGRWLGEFRRGVSVKGHLPILNDADLDVSATIVAIWLKKIT
jgi:Protein of unknown function (DUF3140)